MDREPSAIRRRQGGVSLRTAGFRVPDPAWTIGKHALLGVRAVRANDRTELYPTIRRVPYQWMGVHYQDQDDQPFVLLHNSGGGFIEGDTAECQIVAEPNTRLLATTTAATKFYKCENGGVVEDRLEVQLGAGCVFEYLPDEAIPYEHTRATRVTYVDADADSRVFMSDVLCAGRISFKSGEAFAFTSLTSETSLRVGGRLIWMDRLIADTPTAIADLEALWGGHVVVGTVLAYAPGITESLIDELAESLPSTPICRASVTLLEGKVLCVRALADEAWQVHDVVYDVWRQMRPLIAGKASRQIRKP